MLSISTRPTRLLPTLLALVALCVAALLSACSPMRALNALSPGDTYRATSDVAYGANPRQQLDVYTPTAVAPPGGWPVAVFFYGGSWRHGSRADYRFVGEALASRGILALVADYRLYPEVSYPDFLHDSAKALAWGLEHAAALGGDAKRVFVMGHSAGGYNAAMLALDARWLRAEGHAPGELAGWVGLAGPYDFFPSDNGDVQLVFHDPAYPRGGQPSEHAASTLRTFLGAAKTDSLVDPQRNTVRLATALKTAGADVTLRLYDRVNHLTLAGAFAAPLRFLAPVLDDVAGFMAGTPGRTTGAVPAARKSAEAG